VHRSASASVIIVSVLTLGIAFAGATPTQGQSSAFCRPGQSPQFVLGFAALRESVGDAMGDPIECEHANPENGDSLQQTTRGLAFYRKSTNTPTFTDGFNHWGLTSDGLVTWTGSSIDPPLIPVSIDSLRDLAPTATPTATRPTATPTRGATATPTATPPRPTSTPLPTSTPVPVVRPPIDLQGRGQTGTNPVLPPASISVVTLTHTGERNFIVHALSGSKDTSLTNVIGPYRGQRPLFGGEAVAFDIRADGNWTIHLEAIQAGGSPPFQGVGDAVSPLFTPPANGPWDISHSGQRNFIVHLYCEDRESFIENEIGPVQGSRIIQFGRGPCFWEVRADGAWNLRPRS
jgi:hypothetical protein